MASLYTLDRVNGDSELIGHDGGRRPGLAHRRSLRASCLDGLRGDPHLQSLGDAGEHARAAGADHQVRTT